MKPMFDGRCEEGGVFLGTIKNMKGEFVDLWICKEHGGNVMVLRYGNEPDEYTSSTIPKLPDSGEIPSCTQFDLMRVGLVVTQALVSDDKAEPICSACEEGYGTHCCSETTAEEEQAVDFSGYCEGCNRWGCICP